MNNLDVAGLLHTYAEKAGNAYNTRRLRELITDLKAELDLRKIRMDNNESNNY